MHYWKYVNIRAILRHTEKFQCIMALPNIKIIVQYYICVKSVACLCMSSNIFSHKTTIVKPRLEGCDNV